jgi:hypothetical protein
MILIQKNIEAVVEKMNTVFFEFGVIEEDE